MKELKSRSLLIYDPETGEKTEIDIFRGESAYEAAVRLGLTTLTEDEWVKEYNANRDAAIAAIEAKAAEALASIPEDYTQIQEDVNQLSGEIVNTEDSVNEYINIEKNFEFSESNRTGSFHYAKCHFTEGRRYTITVSSDSAVAPIIRLRNAENSENVQTIGKIDIGGSYTFLAESAGYISAYIEPFLTGEQTTKILVSTSDVIGILNNTPEYYGAVGDGVTDDTIAISNMLNNGHNSYEFRKTYKISGIDVPDKDITLYGNGKIIVTGAGFVFKSPQKHKVIKDLTFELESSATFAIRTDGKPEDTGICTLKIDNVGIVAPQMSTKSGIYMQGETSALLSNVSLEGCGIKVINCTNPTFANFAIMYADIGIYNGFFEDGYGTTEPYACGLSIHNTTIIGCRIGCKVVCVDSVIISESMLDFNDYPVVVIGTEEPKLLSSYFSSRQGNPVIWMDKNNTDVGVFGGNGLSAEEMHYVSIQDCVFIQYNESTENPTIHIGNCECADIRSINAMYAGKAGIEFKNARNVIVDGFICNTKIEGSRCIISYDASGNLNDDSSMTYKNFITSLPIFVKFAKTDLSCDSYVTKVEGSKVIAENTQSITLENVIPQGVERAIVGSSNGTNCYYQESGGNLIIYTGSHTDTIRVNYIVYGKKTYENFV